MTCEVVVTGASGFVGQALISQLRKNGFAVTGVTRRKLNGLITVSDYSETPMSDGAVLVHLAQGANTSDSFGDDDVKLCQVLSDRPWRHIVYASSAIVYGDAGDYLRSPEEQISAFNDYSRVKLTCEKIVLDAGGTCLRLGNLYGPNMNAETVVSAILRQIPGVGPLILQNTAPVRDFLWIDDATRCMVAACRLMPGGILNLGTSSGKAVGDVARLALTLAGERSRAVIGMTDSVRSSCLVLDIAKTREVLQWSPQVELSMGLGRLLGKH